MLSRAWTNIDSLFCTASVISFAEKTQVNLQLTYIIAKFDFTVRQVLYFTLLNYLFSCTCGMHLIGCCVFPTRWIILLTADEVKWERPTYRYHPCHRDTKQSPVLVLVVCKERKTNTEHHFDRLKTLFSCSPNNTSWVNIYSRWNHSQRSIRCSLVFLPSHSILRRTSESHRWIRYQQESSDAHQQRTLTTRRCPRSQCYRRENTGTDLANDVGCDQYIRQDDWNDTIVSSILFQIFHHTPRKQTKNPHRRPTN